MSSTLQMLAGGIILDIAGLAAGELPRFHVNARTLFALVYLTIFGSVIAYSAYIYAMAKLRTTNVSLYAYVNPVVAVILGWLILNEQLTSSRSSRCRHPRRRSARAERKKASRKRSRLLRTKRHGTRLESPIVSVVAFGGMYVFPCAAL